MDGSTGTCCITIRKSAIHGVGVFATRDFEPGDLIIPIEMVFVGAVEDFNEELPTVGIVDGSELCGAR